MFRNREDAGTQLAQKLKAYHGTEAVVLALPRGGVVIGERVAKGLGLPLDIVVARKVGHPTNPEYAICAVDELGTRLCNEVELKHIDKKWLNQRVEQEQQEAQRRTALYRGKRVPIEIAGKTAIIVDDGVATGLTIRLAIKTVKEQKPMRVVVAVPVAPSDVAMKIRREVDEFVVLEPPEDFLGAVGAHYVLFPQVEDPEVIRLFSLV
jgi:predicted phosphoribosyltransferase